MTDPDGAVTSYSYDEAGQLAVTTAPPVTAQVYGGHRCHRAAGDHHRLRHVRRRHRDRGPGRQRHHLRLRRRRPAGIRRPCPRYTPPGGSPDHRGRTTVYDGDGTVTSTTDGLGNTTRYGYDQLGRPGHRRPPRTTASPPPPTTPTGSRCRSPARPAPRSPGHLRLPGPQAHRHPGRAVLRLRDRPLHHQRLLRRQRRRIPVPEQTSPDGVTTSTPTTRPGSRPRSPTAPTTPPRTPTTRSASRPRSPTPTAPRRRPGTTPAGNRLVDHSLDASGTVLADHVGDV